MGMVCDFYLYILWGCCALGSPDTTVNCAGTAALWSYSSGQNPHNSIPGRDPQAVEGDLTPNRARTERWRVVMMTGRGGRVGGGYSIDINSSLLMLFST